MISAQACHTPCFSICNSQIEAGVGPLDFFGSRHCSLDLVGLHLAYHLDLCTQFICNELVARIWATYDSITLVVAHAGGCEHCCCWHVLARCRIHLQGSHSLQVGIAMILRVKSQHPKILYAMLCLNLERNVPPASLTACK
jgi:hypothetical protein